MKRCLQILLGLIHLLGFTCCQAEPITLYAEDKYYPFSFEDGTGLSNSIVSAAYAAVGIEVNYEVMPFPRIMKYLNEGKGLAGFNAASNFDQPNANLLFGKEPIYQAELNYYYSSKRPNPINSLQELDSSNLILGELSDGYYPDEFKNLDARRMILLSDEQIIEMLILGRIDVAYTLQFIVDYHLENLHYPPNILVKVSNFGEHQASMAVVFNAHHPKAQYYSDLLDQGLRQIKQNGIYQGIVATARANYFRHMSKKESALDPE